MVKRGKMVAKILSFLQVDPVAQSLQHLISSPYQKKRLVGLLSQKAFRSNAVYSSDMLDMEMGWNMSFAGCGFMGIYYIGVGSCLQERASCIFDGATKICGASSGALFGAAIVCKIPLDKTCATMMEMAKKARKRSLSVLHPAFNLLKIVHDFLENELPDDAHLLANGRLFVSLTRVSDGQNLLVSSFDSKEDLVQALICSCFFPPFCGWVPPSFRGTRYIDGAVSDNLPLCTLKNTITVSPFSGESDISPCENPFYYHEVWYNNVSIKVNFDNMSRVVGIFLPPELEVLAQVCQDGYRDALLFLHKNNLLKLDPLPELSESFTGKPHTSVPCDEVQQLLDTKNRDTNCKAIQQKYCHLEHKLHWQKEESTNLLPAPIEKVISESCKEDGLYAVAGGFVFVRLLVQIMMLCILPVECAFAFVCRLIEWAPEVISDMQWLCSLTWDFCKLMHGGTLTNRNQVQQKSIEVSCYLDAHKFSSQSLSEWDVSGIPPSYPQTTPSPAHSTTSVIKCRAA